MLIDREECDAIGLVRLVAKSLMGSGGSGTCRSTSEIRCSRVDEGMGTRGGTPPPIRGAPVAEVAVVATISAGDGSAGLDVSPRGKPPAQSLPPLIAQFRWALICA